MGRIAELISNPGEILPLAKIYLASRAATKLPKDPKLAFCYDMLNKVSRSFAVVIQQLPNPLRDAICVFYLVLRGLDTVEDDMSIPINTKVPILKSFHEKIFQRDFSMDCGTHHYQRLMKEFSIVVDVFLSLDQASQDVIADITKSMGDGMAKFIEKEVVKTSEYDLYCHYVAGLVGIGLSQLFAASGLEAPEIAKDKVLANHMGLFLQKTNIIRDYLEDVQEYPEPRMFWPHEIWGKYTAKLEDLKEKRMRTQAVQCLNHMVLDALQHMPHSIEYMQRLQNTQVFRFCAIPQIMAAGTLALCYDNGKVFEGPVKLRRGLTASVFDRCSDMHDLYSWFLAFLDTLEHKVLYDVAGEDPTREDVLDQVTRNKDACVSGLQQLEKKTPSGAMTSLGLACDIAWVLVAGLWVYYAFGIGGAQLPPFLVPLLAPTPHFVVVHQVFSVLFLLMSVHGAVFSDR
ncbi:farnesyl-diphosphate farnesyltransferase [Dunaliella salina]|uniref:Squalene synthase n=1 Tax=Dunaliella salina TaxID=3046 RepID=A0ABQ7H700_DUNSA|nr:farnesyl-diphosphate farnesyltransferase [Dunaliella salina]|eukprot:KAF5842637.1 farnesyl-diphosphate farnesyltransferase [Dunaliella salina]